MNLYKNKKEGTFALEIDLCQSSGCDYCYGPQSYCRHEFESINLDSIAINTEEYWEINECLKREIQTRLDVSDGLNFYDDPLYYMVVAGFLFTKQDVSCLYEFEGWECYSLQHMLELLELLIDNNS